MCGEGKGGARPLRQAPGFRERPVKEDGLAQHRDRWALGQQQGDVVGARAHQRHLPLQPQEDSVKMERNMR